MSTNLRHSIRRDKRIRVLLTALEESPIFEVDVETLLDEMATIQAVRVANKLQVTKPELLDQVIANSARDQGARSRLAEIKFQAYRASHQVTSHVNVLSTHIQVTYNEEIKAEYRTGAERRSFIDSVLEPFIVFATEMGDLTQQADILIADIDKNAWGLKTVLDAITVHTQREHTI